ncbi:MAG TPA: class I SAM-dependent methyltransferase [Desertimonas sp.]|nr:class I SAM-dependent methyltransferase [Desertimonas sp.]
MTWAEEFSYGYDDWTAGVTADIDFYVGLAREAGSPIVELAIGSGRVAVPIALATRRPVVGVDTSPAMLESARRRADAAGVELVLHLGDMVDLQLDEPAALIICPFRALLHIRTWAARRRLFERVTASLRPGGRFAWNAFAFDHHFAARVDGVRVVEGRFAHTDHFAVGDNRVDIVLDTGAKSSLWWATKNEWLGLIDVAGLELEALYGDFDSTPFNDRSGEYVFITRRPPS